MITRRYAIARRWADIVFLASAGFGAGLLALPRFNCRAAWEVFSSSWPALCALTVAAVWYVGRPPRSWFSLRHALTYPPAWFAALAGALGLVVYSLERAPVLNTKQCQAGAITKSDVYVTILECLAVAGGVLLAIGAFARLGRALRRRFAAPAPAIDASWGVEWVNFERPITFPQEDRFGHNLLARRIADLICSDAEPTLALIGPYGAGKSSLLNLATDELRRRGLLGTRIEVVQVSLWPFDTVDAAIGGVLSRLTRSMDAHVGTLPFRGIEEQYVKIVEGAAPWWGKLIRLAGPASPRSVLRAYDLVASAIGIKFVLWVDDFERFAGMAKAEAEPEFVRFAPLRALLNELAELQHVQVVLASGAARFRFDIEKFARYVIDIPPVQGRDVTGVVMSVRSDAIARYKDDFDIASQAVREESWPVREVESLAWLESLGTMSISRAISGLLRTPRELKQALRYFVEAWERLHGEVDVDELLIVSVLRVVEPAITTLINTHISELRHGTAARLLGKDETRAEFARKLDELLEASGTPNAAEIRYLVTEMFPGWETGEGSGRTRRRPQGFGAEHVDYWRRYVALERPTPESSDQRALALIDSWKRASSGAELPRILAEGGHPSLEAFVAISVKAEQLLWLLVQVVRAHARLGEHSWPGLGEPPGVTALWRVMLQKRPPTDELKRIVDELIAEVVPGNLGLAFALVHVFGTIDAPGTRVLEPEQMKAVAAGFRERLRTAHAGSPETLVAALRGSRTETMYWSCWGLERARSGELGGVPFDGWAEVARTLLDAVAIDPIVVIPQILPFVVRSRDVIRHAGTAGGVASHREYELDSDALERLFSVEAFAKVYQAHANYRFQDPDTQMRHEAAVSGLQQVYPSAG